MECKGKPVAVCSWSLQKDIAGVAEDMGKLGLEHVNLAVRPAVEDESGAVLDAIKAQSWTITSTMVDLPQEDYSTLERIKVTGGVVPDESWDYTRDLFAKSAKLTAELGVKYVGMHAGFVDESDEAYAAKIHDRIRTLADLARDNGIMLLLETGQETAEELKTFLEKLNHDALGVNFDPANMVLYDKGNPIEAIRVLAPWVRHVHIKDGTRTKEPGTWGVEVPWGDGEVGAAEFLAVLDEVGFKGAMAIEREQGDNRFGDIKLAVERLAAAG